MSPPDPSNRIAVFFIRTFVGEHPPYLRAGSFAGLSLAAAIMFADSGSPAIPALLGLSSVWVAWFCLWVVESIRTLVAGHLDLCRAMRELTVIMREMSRDQSTRSALSQMIEEARRKAGK